VPRYGTRGAAPIRHERMKVRGVDAALGKGLLRQLSDGAPSTDDSSLAQLLDDAGRSSDDLHELGHISRHHRSGTNDRSLAD